MRILIDLFDYSGNNKKPYEDNGWHIIQVDIKHGIDILDWDYQKAIWDVAEKMISDYLKTHLFCTNKNIEIGIIADIPCTDYALSGARHFAQKDQDGRTAQSQKLVEKTKEIIDYCKAIYTLRFWRLENPASRIHKLNPWMGSPKLKFNPCDYAGHIIPEHRHFDLAYYKQLGLSKLTKKEIQVIIDCNAYNKQTWIWGNFNMPTKNRVEPVFKENPGWLLYGGKSEKTKELRSITPIGFCNAFYLANH
jgi:hypothetical protein